jgi:hypothetical protein
MDALSTDPQLSRFLHQLQTETQRQKFTEQVSADSLCLSIAGAHVDQSLLGSVLPGRASAEQGGRAHADLSQQLCQSCVGPSCAKPFAGMIDASNFMVEHLQQMESARGGFA